MDGVFDIADSTDWLNTPLKDLAPLENALHCQVCKEFINTPMITSCSHTFCSRCIRTSLSGDGKCPACRAPDQASKLRNNWALQEIVGMFMEARPAVLQVARKEQEAAATQTRRPGKRKRVIVDPDNMVPEENDGRTTRSQARRIAASQEDIIEIDDADGDADFEPELDPDDGKVECPLGCGKRMKMEQVEPHLDRCEDEKKQISRAKSRTSPSNGMTADLRGPEQQERISQLNYTLTKESALRKKMDDLGIPNSGTKALMERRHKEWVNIWNANCDSSQPRSKRELLTDLKAWERTQGGNAPQVTNHLMKKEFDGVGWANKHNDDFTRLIADAKRKKPNCGSALRKEDIESQLKTSGSTGDEKSSPHFPPSAPIQRLPDPSSNRPYEGNLEAMDSVRRKVEAANAGRAIEPLVNEGLKPYDAHTSPRTAILNGICQSSQANIVMTPPTYEASHHQTSSKDEHAVAEQPRSTYDLASHLV